MTEPAEQPTAPRRCSRCGAELPSQVPPDLCPRCLLNAGLATAAGGADATAVLSSAGAAQRGLPQPGEQLGHYRILRPLGGGGMGTVFEAEDLESGRRLALKVLAHTLDTPEARERFFREGRLAASINHPNSVYVFGTEEIAGTPVIAMELVAGGTLEERVRSKGPMPPAEAVDVMLQVIAGLEAAQRIGILHRDIKPSNCFVDTDGTVKIGDFGLSIATAIRTEAVLTATGTFLGTPAFCSPEQLRGEELNARSDMYSAGATLFYLLTGRTPFEAKNVVALIATVLEQAAPSPKDFRRAIPLGLAKVVRRCLEKQPTDRFRNYEELRQALAPYTSSAAIPATLWLRLVAGLVDSYVLSFLGLLLLLPGVGNPLKNPFSFLELASEHSWKVACLMAAGLGASVLYYALAEGIWGTTVGKALCRLRVVGPEKNVPGFWRGLGRAVIYLLAPALPGWLIIGANPASFLGLSSGFQYVVASFCYVLLALLFSTARRRNGFAAVHDLVTKTRVISRASLLVRPLPDVGEVTLPAVAALPMVGPYHVLETLAETEDGKWLLGYDLRLLRKVWVRLVPAATPPVPATLRNLGRIGRLRWLAGRRSAAESWDAFEAVSGQPLLKVIQQPQPWSQVRFWLWDLAIELGAAQKDGSPPARLALDRVWITGEGRAKLLDFAPPEPGPATVAGSSGEQLSVLTQEQGSEIGGAGPSERGLPPILPQGQGLGTRGAHPPDRGFLAEVATAALTGRAATGSSVAGGVAARLPLHAREFLQGLPQMLDANAVALALKPLLERVAAVTRRRRVAVLGGCVAFPALAVGMVFLGLVMMQRWNRDNPGILELNTLLQQRQTLRFWRLKVKAPTDTQYAVYIARHYRSVVTNASSWSTPLALVMIKGDARRFAEQSVADYTTPTTNEIASAEAALKRFQPKEDIFVIAKRPSFPLIVASATLAIYVGFPTLVAALLFRGGIVLRVAGIAFVRKDGVRASRGRVFWRALVAWSPVALALMLGAGSLAKNAAWLPWLAAGLVCMLAIFSVLLPGRSLQDRLAGTWPVPR